MKNKKYASFFLILLGVFIISLPLLPILLYPDNALVMRDLLRSFIPSKLVWLMGMRESFHPPYWNPYILGGNPYWADMGQGSFNPLNLIFLFFPYTQITNAFSWFIWIHLLFAAGGMYLYLRNSGLERHIGWLFAIAYAISGTMISSFTQPNVVGAAALLPFSFYFLSRSKKDLSLISGNLFGMASCLAGFVILGSPDFAYFYCLAFCAKFLFEGKRGIIKGCLVGIFAFFLSAIQLLPGLDQLLQSHRGLNKLTLQEAQWLSFHPARLIEMLIPLPFGNYIPKGEYWGAIFTNGPMQTPLFFSNYFGAGIFIGLVAYFFSEQKSKTRLLICALIVLIFSASFGPFSPVNIHALLFRFLPLWSSFRYPEKLLVLINFIFLFIAAHGWSAALNNKLKINPLLFKSLIFISFTICFGSALFFLQATGHQISGFSFIWVTLIFILFLLILKFSQNIGFQKYTFPLLSLLLLSDICLHGRKILWEQPVSILESPLAQKIHDDLVKNSDQIDSGGAYRIVSFTQDTEKALWTGSAPQELDPVGKVAWTLAYNLSPSINTLSGLSHIFSYGTQHSTDKESFHRSLAHSKPDRLINIMGARYIIKAPEAEPPKVFVNNEALPFVFTPAKVNALPNSSKIFERLNQTDFDPKTEMLIESDTVESKNNLVSPSLSIKRESYSKLKIQISENKKFEPFWLHIGETFDKNWVAQLNGEHKLPIYKANGWGMAIFIPKGGLVELQYQNPLIIWGILLSLSFWIFVLLKIIFYSGRITKRY